MKKDPRYEIIREKILKGEITMIDQIYDYIPREIVDRDLGKITFKNAIGYDGPDSIFSDDLGNTFQN